MPPASRFSNWRLAAGAAAAGALVVGFCLLLLWHNPELCWKDDYAISILPVFADVARAWNEGHLPLLSPYSWTCANLAGEYQYGTFSVFVNAVVVAVGKFPLKLAQQAAALSFAHLAVLAAGAFLLARQRRLPTALAMMVAGVAALNGWMIGWGASDWFGALAAFTWLPWCWWAFEGALRRDAGWTRRLAVPAGCVYLLVAGGFPYTVGMLALLTLWLALRAGWRERTWRGRFAVLWPLASGWALGLGLAAPALLSLVEYMRGSDRARETDLLRWTWTVPVRALPGLVLPSWTVAWTNFMDRPAAHAALELTGGLAPVAGLLAALARLRWRAVRALRWELGLLGATLLLCILPSPGVFRWSFRWLPLFHLVLALTAARGLHLLAAAGRWRATRAGASEAGRRVAGNPGVWATLLVGLVWSAMRGTGGVLAVQTFGLGVAWAVAEAALPARRRGARVWAPAAVAFLSMLAAYRHLDTNPGVPGYAFGENLKRPAPLATDRLYLSFYREPHYHGRIEQTPANHGAVLRPGSTGMFAGVRLINGYSPIMTAGIGRLLGMETHGSLYGKTADWLLGWEAGPDGLLARLGVDGLIVARDYPVERRPPEGEWEEVFSSDEGRVFHRRGSPFAEARAWTSADVQAEERFAVGEVKTLENSRQRVVAQVAVPAGGAPALVAFRRPFLPGYHATLDGAPLPVGSFRGLLPTVEVPAGRAGKLVLWYWPRGLAWGAACSLGSLLALAGTAVLGAARKRPVGVSSRMP